MKNLVKNYIDETESPTDDDFENLLIKIKEPKIKKKYNTEIIQKNSFFGLLKDKYLEKKKKSEKIFSKEEKEKEETADKNNNLNLSFGVENNNNQDISNLEQTEEQNGNGFSFCDNISADYNSENDIFNQKKSETMNLFGGLSKKSSSNRIFSELEGTEINNNNNLNFLSVFSNGGNYFNPNYEDESFIKSNY